jgi:hypothetical protein
MAPRRFVQLAAAAALVGLAAAGVPQLVSQRGWKPMVALAGGGDADQAVAQLQASVDTFEAILQGLWVDTPTRAFASDLRDSLESFDLEGFHEALPEQGDDAWRELRVVGRQDGKRYRLQQAGEAVECAVSPDGLGSRLGDLALRVRSRPVEDEGDVNYLVRAEAGVGLGRIGWSQVQAGLAETARLIASGDPNGPGVRRDMTERAGTQTRVRILESHPNLRPEDIEVLGLLWEAFPALGEVVHSVARVDDLLVYDPKGDASYQQLRLAGRLRPDLMEEAYPELAEFLQGMGRLAHVQIQWVDEAGRQLARMSFESERLKMRLTCFVADGRLVPVEGGRVRLDLVDPEGPRKLRALVDVRSQVNGIQSRVHGMQVAWDYTPSEVGMELVASVTEVPKVSVSGQAFGILPTWAVDAVIPGNMDELMREFLQTACEGNEGRGVELAVRTHQAPDGAGVASLGLGLEVLDSTLISLAMRIASMKLLPDDAVRSELHTLLCRFHEAFAADLARFEGLRSE